MVGLAVDYVVHCGIAFAVEFLLIPIAVAIMRGNLKR
jgi:hypothetical protein